MSVNMYPSVEALANIEMLYKKMHQYDAPKQDNSDSTRISPSNKDLAMTFVKNALDQPHTIKAVAENCRKIIELQQNMPFLEAILEVCRKYYMDLTFILTIAPKSQYRIALSPFMLFLAEMFFQLKECDSREAMETLINLLFKSFQKCLHPDLLALSELKCMLKLLRSIGTEMAAFVSVDALIEKAKDTFLYHVDPKAYAMRSIILQIIELKAPNWQPTESVQKID